MLTSIASSMFCKGKTALLSPRGSGTTSVRNFAAFPAPRLFDYDTIVNNLKMDEAIVASIEEAFGALSRGEVDVPLPMHIGIPEDVDKVSGESF